MTTTGALPPLCSVREHTESKPMTQTVSFTFDDDELASVAIQAIAEHLAKSKPDSVSVMRSSPKTQGEWIMTQEMAHCLGVSVRTLMHYRDNGDLFVEGCHYRLSLIHI